MITTEFRNAVRRLLHRPGYTALSLLVLSLGLGAMLFTLDSVNSMVLKPLPFPQAERLVTLGHSRASSNWLGDLDSADFLRLREELRGIEAMGGYANLTANLSPGGGAIPKRYDGVVFDLAMFDLLGVQPILGRAFSAEDDRPGAPTVALLSHRVWRNDFAGDPGILGRNIQLNGQPATLIGVMPEGFHFPANGDVWMPRRMAVDDGWSVEVVARLAPGVGLEQFRDEATALAARLGAELGGAQDQRVMRVAPLSHRFVNESTRGLLWMMFGAGLLVLLLACINIANLQLVQGLARRRELALRAALGAGRASLLRELLIESLILSALATVLALALAVYCGDWIMGVFIANEEYPLYWIGMGLDPMLVVYGAGAAVMTTVLAGLWPALRASRTDAQQVLRDGERGSGGGFAQLVRSLVVVEIAVTVVLLVGAGLFVRGLQGMMQVEVGSRVEPESVLTGRVGAFEGHFPTGAEQVAFFGRVVARLRADPRVIEASAATGLPGFAGGGNETVVAEGEAMPADGYLEAEHARVDDHFLATWDIPLRAGRFFDGRDQVDSDAVAVIDEALAERLWPGRDPLGQRMRVNPQRERVEVLTVVGVVAPLHLDRVENRRNPGYLVPLRQQPTNFTTLAVLARGDARTLAPLLAEAVRAEQADTAVYWIRTQAQAMRMGRIGIEVLTQVFAAVGLLALVLATSGLYGVLAFTVEQRSREIGIRRAIGAGNARIAGLVGWRLAGQVGVGLAIGLALALPWSRLLSGQLPAVRGGEPLLLLLVALLVAAVAIGAAMMPLRRALSIDPLQALRQE
jgi:predicted permease